MKNKNYLTHHRLSFGSATKIIILACFLGLSTFSCKKSQSDIPYETVNYDVSLNDPSNVNLNSVGGWVYITAGVRGIILYRKSQTDFLAFERNCPYKPNDACARIFVESNNVSAKDDCCGSVYSILEGTVLSGPSTRPLKQYSAVLAGTNVHLQN